MAVAVESADAIVAAFERHIFEDLETRPVKGPCRMFLHYFGDSRHLPQAGFGETHRAGDIAAFRLNGESHQGGGVALDGFEYAKAGFQDVSVFALFAFLRKSG